MLGQASVRLPAAKPGLLVPAAALVRDGAERYVVVEEGPGQYRRRYVVVERRKGDTIQVAQNAGRFPGDRVLTTGSHEVGMYFVQGVLRLSPEAVRGTGLRVESAGRRPFADVVLLQDVIDLPSERRAVVSSRLAGTLHRIAVDRDQVVRPGEVVAEVASLELQNLQLEMLRNHLQAGLLERQFRGLRSAASKGASPPRTLCEIESALVAARQRRDSVRRKLLALGLSAEQIGSVLEGSRVVDSLPVRAPIAGTVVRFQATLGQVVKADDPLFEVHDPTGAGLRLFVAERQLAKVRVGQRGRVRLVADPSFEGEAEAGQPLRQHGPRRGESAGDRPLGDAKLAGRRLAGFALQVTQDEGHPVLIRQPTQLLVEYRAQVVPGVAFGDFGIGQVSHGGFPRPAFAGRRPRPGARAPRRWPEKRPRRRDGRRGRAGRRPRPWGRAAAPGPRTPPRRGYGGSSRAVGCQSGRPRPGAARPSGNGPAPLGGSPRRSPSGGDRPASKGYYPLRGISSRFSVGMAERR
jgi:multidrug efflux pump subunit AcrA (membrane-fusion protein)